MATAGRILIIPKGKYSSATQYEQLDLVLHNGDSWLAKQNVKGVEPSDNNSAYWHRFTDILNTVKSNVLDSLDAVSENEQEDMIAGALAVKELESKMNEVEAKIPVIELDEANQIAYITTNQG